MSIKDNSELKDRLQHLQVRRSGLAKISKKEFYSDPKVLATIEKAKNLIKKAS